MDLDELFEFFDSEAGKAGSALIVDADRQSSGRVVGGKRVVCPVCAGEGHVLVPVQVKRQPK